MEQRKRWVVTRGRAIALALTPAIILGVLLGWSSLVSATTLRAYVVPTGSMSPAIASGERILVQTRITQLPNRGEIWTFQMPRSSGAGIGVKRVIGLPGETIEVRSGAVYLNGRPLRESYIVVPGVSSMPPVNLGDDEYFVLGDARNTSLDSRNWGPLPAAMLRGRAVYRFWPSRRMGGL